MMCGLLFSALTRAAARTVYVYVCVCMCVHNLIPLEIRVAHV